MITAKLFVSLAWEGLRPRSEPASVGRLSGGPELLLGWLETQLGLPSPQKGPAARVAELAKILADADTAEKLKRLGSKEVKLADSARRDTWSTAQDCLYRLEQLRLHGFTGKEKDLPPLARVLAVINELEGDRLDDTAARILRVISALDGGQKLPPHEIALYEKVEQWPLLWRRLFGHGALKIRDASSPRAKAPESSSLGRWQRAALGEGEQPIASLDESLCWLASPSALAACEAVAAALAREPGGLSNTAVYCENPSLAMMLDEAFARRGLPAMGVSTTTTAHPALQLLPATIRLCWKPVDPHLLMDFLNMPFSPFGGVVRKRLSKALASQPGLGSEEWEKAIEELTCTVEDGEENEKRKALLEQLEQWKLVASAERKPIDQPLDAGVVAERCRLVGNRLSALAHSGRFDDEATLEQLMHAREICLEVARAAEVIGGEIPEPQVFRMIETATGGGLALSPRAEQAGAPVWVTSLAEIDRPFERLVWLGLTTEDPPAGRWPRYETELLRKAGVDLDDGLRLLRARRAAERRGLAMVEKSVLAVEVAGEEERMFHPLWILARALMKDGDSRGVAAHRVRLDLALENEREMKRLGPWRFGTARFEVAQPAEKITSWQVPADLLKDRSSCSASSLETRLGCPLKWVLQYAARINRPAGADIPADFKLEGNFCHWVIQRALLEGGELPSPDEAARRVVDWFDKRLELDAAPLAGEDKRGELRSLRKDLESATRLLVETLHRGGWKVVGFEVPIDDTGAEVDGKKLSGSIDCLVERDDGCRGVIDFKHRGAQKYPGLLAESRAVQLAVYAYSQAGGGPFPQVAYLLIRDRQLVTSSGSRLEGCGDESVVEGKSIGEVWTDFLDAIRKADGWLQDGKIPVRPLQDDDDWPEGAYMVISPVGSSRDKTPLPCKYCDYGVLCGLQEVL